MWIPIRVLIMVLMATGPSIKVGKAIAVNFSMFGYLSALTLPVRFSLFLSMSVHAFSNVDVCVCVMSINDTASE
jgi:hypothetical protein